MFVKMFKKQQTCCDLWDQRTEIIKKSEFYLIHLNGYHFRFSDLKCLDFRKKFRILLHLFKTQHVFKKPAVECVVQYLLKIVFF